MTRPFALAALAAAALAAGCGGEGIKLSEDDPNYEGAQLFVDNCAGCHTLEPAGTEGTANRSERVQGPDFDERTETYDDVLYAIRNGGYSGAIMPQNIVVGEEAEKVARFVAEASGSNVDDPAQPGQDPE